MGFRRPIAAVASALVLAGTIVVGLPAVAGATAAGDTQGCTPGYWKNHQGNWQEYSPTTTLSHMLRTQGGVDYTFPGALGSYGSLTMAQALSLKGGPGADGAAQILLRAGTAAYLNAAFDIAGGTLGLFYPYRRFSDTSFNGVTFPALQPSITGALTGLDRDTMLALATNLDAANNLGCPLS